jgi:hypothetical protein
MAASAVTRRLRNVWDSEALEDDPAFRGCRNVTPLQSESTHGASSRPALPMHSITSATRPQRRDPNDQMEPVTLLAVTSAIEVAVQATEILAAEAMT